MVLDRKPERRYEPCPCARTGYRRPETHCQLHYELSEQALPNNALIVLVYTGSIDTLSPQGTDQPDREGRVNATVRRGDVRECSYRCCKWLGERVGPDGHTLKFVHDRTVPARECFAHRL